MNKVLNIQAYHSVVAIDPDVDRNGVAYFNTSDNVFTINSYSFPQTLEYLYGYKSLVGIDKNAVIVIIEAGWLNHAHWHAKWGDSSKVIAAKGNSVGRNHEVGRKIVEMCEYWKIPYKLVSPLKKIWKGKNGKITATEFERLTGYKGRSNQDARDAGLILWAWAKGNINGF